MPKAKTMLDELARVLKARKNAVSRFDRREQDWFRVPLRNEWYDGKSDPWANAPAGIRNDVEYRRQLMREAGDLSRDLGDRAVMEYDRLMRSNPSRRDMQKAWDMLPDELVREHDYFD